MKIATRISFYFFITGLILSGIAAPIFFFVAKDILEKSITDKFAAVLESRSDHVRTYLKALYAFSDQLSKSMVLEDFLKAREENAPEVAELLGIAKTRLENTRAANPSIKDFTLLDKNGQVTVSASGKYDGKDMSHESIFLGAQDTHYIRDVYYDEGYNDHVLTVSSPVLDNKTGEFLGVVEAIVSSRELNEITMDTTGMGDTGEIYIVNKYGYICTPSRFLEDVVLKEKAELVPRGKFGMTDQDGFPASSGKLQIKVTTDYRGIKVFHSARFLPAMDWTITYEADVEEELKLLEKLKLTLGVIMLLVPIFSWFFGIYFSKKITKSIHSLREGVEKITLGELNHDVATNDKDEIGQLSRAFSDMLKNLKQHMVSIDTLTREVKERKKAEEYLAESERKSRLLIENAVSGIAVHEILFDEKGKAADYIFENVNPAFEVHTGLKASEVVGKKVTEVLPGIEKTSFISIYGKVVTTGDPVSFEEYSPQLARYYFINAYSLGEKRFATVFADITGRKKAEKEVIESEKRYRVLFEGSRDAIMTLKAPSWKFVSANSSTLEMFRAENPDDFLSCSPSDLSPGIQPDGAPSEKKAREMIETAVREGTCSFEWMHKRLDGEVFPALVLLSKITDGGEPLLSATVRDITDEKKIEQERDLARKELEKSLNAVENNRQILVSMLEDNNATREELEKAMETLKDTRKMVMEMEKLEAIGRMASGLAHEVRNPLGVILQGVNYIENVLPKDNEKFQDVMSMIKRNLKKADGIISSLLDFSRASSFKLEPEDIGEIIESALIFIRHDARYENVIISKKIQDHLPKIPADKIKIEQVFINLFSNAVHAMLGGGKLEVKAYMTTLEFDKGKKEERYGDFFSAGDRVLVVEVEDTGEGIKEENIVKVFDPFFTTKEQGKGTGLGLSVTKSIMDMHGAVINLESSLGKGTKVTLYFRTDGEYEKGGDA